MDLVRSILLAVEDGENDFRRGLAGHPDAAPWEVSYHLQIMRQGSPIEARTGLLDHIQVHGLTWEGHELLDRIRDPEVWRRTKASASAVGAWTVDVLKDLATAYLKQVLKKRVGLEPP